MNNPMAMIGQFQQFMQNPAAILGRSGIPQQYLKDPSGAIQYLMNSGKLTQQQYNQASQMAKQLQNSQQFRQIFGN